MNCPVKRCMTSSTANIYQIFNSQEQNFDVDPVANNMYSTHIVVQPACHR